MLTGLNRLFTILMVSAVLFSSNGLVLSIHSCLFNNSKEIDLFTDSDCCKDIDDCHNEGPCKEKKVNPTCCTSEITYLKTASVFLNKKVFHDVCFNVFEQTVSYLIPRTFSIHYPENGFLNKPAPFKLRQIPMLI
jgi:hypothetical protein